MKNELVKSEKKWYKDYGKKSREEQALIGRLIKSSTVMSTVSKPRGVSLYVIATAILSSLTTSIAIFLMRNDD